MSLLVESSMYVSTAIVVVALLRKVLRRVVGAQLAYWLWSLVPACAAVVALPPPARLSDHGGESFSQSLVSMLPNMELGSIANATTDYATVGAVVWVSVGLIMFGFMVRRQRAFVRSLGTLVLAPDGTYRSTTVRSPLLLGILQPRIILPANFETLYHPDEQALVLAHEQAHRRRGDMITNAVAAFCLCLSWFNPLMYWAVGRLRFDQELACDAWVLASSGRGRSYALALLKTQLTTDSASHISFGCHWQSSHPLKERIIMIKCPPPSLARRLLGVFVIGTLITGCSYTAWATQPELEKGGAQQLQIRVSADQISTSANGDISAAGRVIVSRTSEGGPAWAIRAATMKQLDDGAAEALGAVQISFKDTIITADRAIVRRNGTIEMEQASISMLPRGSVK
jgi:beta-lactamase regulating signal transducer with metallopeptidase domain